MHYLPDTDHFAFARMARSGSFSDGQVQLEAFYYPGQQRGAPYFLVDHNEPACDIAEPLAAGSADHKRL